MKNMMRFLIPAILLTSGCAYRYGAGYFIANDRKEPEPDHYTMTLPSAEPVASAVPVDEDCEQVIEQLEVTNKLDNKNNTITTTAVTKRDRSRKCP